MRHFAGLPLSVPVPAGIDRAALALPLAAFAAIFSFKAGMPPLLAGPTLLGALACVLGQARVTTAATRGIRRLLRWAGSCHGFQTREENMRNGKIAMLAAALLLPAAGAVWAQSAPSVLDGVYTEAQAAKGQTEFAQQCAACHGSGLSGNGEAPALVGAEFISDWAGLTLGDLFERIRTTMPQNKAGKLSREVNADITAYILSVNKFPSGKAELPHTVEFLKEIRIDSEKK